MERVAMAVGKNMLTSASDEASAVMAKLKVGEIVGVEIYRERANKFSSRVQFVFERIAKAQGMRVRNVRGWIAAQTGRADAVHINGKMALVAHGTGPRDMGNDEFDVFWDDAKQVITEEILPTLTPDDAADVRTLMEFDIE